MSDDPAKPPRFPYIAALLCAACVGAAAWTWMRYSYCWDVTPRELVDGGPGICFGDTDELYVRLMGQRVLMGEPSPGFPNASPQEREASRWLARRVRHIDAARSNGSWGIAMGVGDSGHSAASVDVFTSSWSSYPPNPEDFGWDGNGYVGRVEIETWGPVLLVGTARNLRKQFKRFPVIHTERSRFHPASIAGLVVGAMGVFVFTVALRHWLGERRKSREEARA